MGITSAGIQHARLVISRFNLFYFSAGNSIPPSYIYIYIYIPSRIQVHGFHLKPLSESSCARQRDRLRREFVFAQCFRFIIDESLPAFPPLIPRNVLKQVLIKSREEFIYIYISFFLSFPFIILVSPLLVITHTHFIVYRIMHWPTDDEFGEKTVSILLDGEESEMVFIDHPHVEMSVSTIPGFETSLYAHVCSCHATRFH